MAFSNNGGVSLTDATLTTVYTASANNIVIIGFTIANTTTAALKASALLGAKYLVKNADVPVGGTLSIADESRKICMDNAQLLKVQTDSASGGVDVIVSYMV